MLEKDKVKELMEQAYIIGTNISLPASIRVEAMKAYASLSLALHNMTY